MSKIEYTIQESELIAFKKRKYVRAMVNKAIARGDIERSTSCELCKKSCKTNAHHVDYGNPFRINWLCSKCHGLAHRQGHHLNPTEFKQSPLPDCVGKYDSILISFSIPTKTFLAIKKLADNQNKPISALMQELTIKLFPVADDQLEFKFEETDDITQSIIHERISSVATHEGVLLQQKQPAVQKVRSKWDISVPHVEKRLQKVFSRHG